MKKIGIIAGMLVFIAGIFLGALFNIHRLEASDPGGEVSGGEQAASTFWHEHWQATEGYVSSETGYEKIGISLTPTSKSPVVSGKMVKKISQPAQVTIYPNMMVTKWKVHGHIHFR